MKSTWNAFDKMWNHSFTRWSDSCMITNYKRNSKFAIAGAKVYVPVVSLSKKQRKYECIIETKIIIPKKQPMEIYTYQK